jgi:hypothetical protein
MGAGSFRFRVGEFECVSVNDGALNYPPESFFANVSLERVEEALRERNLPTAQIMTPYTCLFIDTGEHRMMVDMGAGDLGAHAADVFPGLDHSTSVTGLLRENLRAAGIEPSEIDTVIVTTPTPTTLEARWTRRESSFSPTPTISSRKRSGISGPRMQPPQELPP